MSARWQIDRRMFLRGVGAALALPALEAMAPSLGSVVSAATASAAGGGKYPKRMAFLYVPNGVTMADWRPEGTGEGYDLPRILEPLAPYKKDFSVLSGFAQQHGFAEGDGAGDHARASASFLTGTHPRKTSGRDIRAGVSVDQIAAERIGAETALPSLELSCDAGQRLGSCDSGYSCAYQFNVSWRSESMPMMPEVDPRQVFERLFGDVAGGKIAAQQTRSRRLMLQRSLLDFVSDDARRLRSRLGTGDGRKLDEYLTAVRDVEKRVELAQRTAPRVPADVKAPGEFHEFDEHVRLMLDMLALAFQTDSTRVATFIISHEGSNRPYPFAGVNEGHHDLSHHQGNPETIEKITKVNTFHVKQLAYFLGKLKAAKEGDGSVLDHSMIVYGSGICDGDRHNHDDLPILLAGGGGGTLRPGRHVAVPKRTPLNNLYLSMLDRLGSGVQRFGDSTGRFEGIG